MKKLKFALVAFIMLLMISAGAEASEFIFKYSDDAPQPAVFDFEAEYFDMNIYFTDDEEGIKRLSEKGYIEYYERNTEIYLPDEPEPDVSLMSMPNDSLVERQMEYEFNVTNAQGVVNNTIACGDYSGIRGQGVRIGIIDTGIDQDHPDIDYSRVNQYDIFTKGNVANDFDGHGTGVAGIIAARTDNGIGLASLAPEAEIYVIKVYKDDSKTTDSQNLLDGCKYAVTVGCDVVNISSGMPANSKSLREYIDKMNSYGIIVVAAAGNHNSSDADPYPEDSKPLYPAAWDSVISVAAVDSEGERTWFSYHNAYVDTAAAGLYVQVLTNGGGYGTNSGTSFSSPFVASVAALAKQLDMSIDAARFCELLELTSTDKGVPGKDTLYGYGIINVGAMLDYMLHGVDIDIADMIDVGEIEQENFIFTVTVVNNSMEPVELIDSWTADFGGQMNVSNTIVTAQPGENKLTYSGLGKIRHFVWFKENIRPLCPVQTAEFNP